MDAALRDRDPVQGAVELAVAAAVEPVTSVLAGARFERRDTGMTCELCIRIEAVEWEARPFEAGWVKVVPVGSSPYAGGWYLMRHDGAVVSISSNPAIHGEDETRNVIREIGATAAPDEISDEIRQRTASRLA